jgi:two-component system LytT family response regulator
VIRALIVDDEPPARENLRLLLEREPDVEVIEECGSGAAAVRAIARHEPDLVFLDVQMPAMDGFDVIRSVGPERMPITVFVTAYDRYALRAFEAQALDYLLKPFDDARFVAVLERARGRLREREEGSLARRMMALIDERGSAEGESPRYLTHLTVRHRDRVLVLPVGEIERFEAAGDYVRAHAGGRTHLADDTMKGLEERLDPRRFVRIHRSHIVRVDRIRELEPFFHGDWIVRLEGGVELRMSRTRRAALEQALGREL